MDEINKSNSCSYRRAHLTKEQRLPQYLKETEKILLTVKSCKSNFKTVLANSRLRGSVYKKVYNLTVNVLKCYNYIQKIIDKINLLEKEKFLRREIATILIYEMIFGINNLPGESKIITTIRTYESDIMKVHQELQSSNIDSFIIKEINIPRYVRVHTLVTTVPYVIKDLECLGFKQIDYDCLSEEKYLELIKNLEQGCFVIDFHFKDILVFSCGENLTSLDLYKNGHIFLQDKASYIPVLALNPEPGCAVLDACAAPGMKTLHIASKMKNKGILIACERDKDRFETLKEMVQCGAVKICKALCKDFKMLDPNDQAYSTIEYILLDPSCSGSGMVSRMDEVTDTEDSKTKERLTKLAGFQIILLKHALRFPSVKRVVYSTCSVNEEENEYVVHEALNSCYGAFKLVPVMPEWSERGSENFEFGNLCLRTVPEKHLTNGFFVALFERVNCGEYGERMHFPKNKKSTDTLQNKDEYCSDFKMLKKKKMKDDLVDFQKKPEICVSSVYDENSVQFMEEKDGAKEIISRKSKEGKKLMKKMKKGGQNAIDFQSETNTELGVNNDDDENASVFHEEKEHESCEPSPYQSKKSGSNSREFKKKSKGNNQVLEDGESYNHFKEEKHIVKEINFDYDSKKSKKLKNKKKEKGEKNIDSCSEINEELPEKLTNVNSSSQGCSIIANISPSDVSGTVDDTFGSPKTKEKGKGKRHLSLEIVSEYVQITDSNSDVPVHKKKKRKREHSKDCDLQSNELNSFSDVDVPVHKKKKRKREHPKDSDLQSNELNLTDADVPVHKEKRKKEHSKNSDFQSDELSNLNNADMPVHKKKKRKKAHSKDSDCQSNELNNSSNADVPVQKRKKEYSDFQLMELNESIGIDGNLSLPHNEYLDLPDTTIHSLVKPSKHKKSKKIKHRDLDAPDKNIQLSPAVNFYEAINEMSSQNHKQKSTCASFEDDCLKSRKYGVEKTDEIVYHGNVQMAAPLENDYTIGNTSKKHKSQKTADPAKPGKAVSNDFEGAFVCASSVSDPVRSKKSKSKKKDNEVSKDFKNTDEIPPHNQELYTSIENDVTIKKKSKKCKSRKHGIEKMDDLVRTDGIFYPEELGNSIKNDSAEKNKNMDDSEIADGTIPSVQNDCVAHKKSKKHKKKKNEIENVVFLESENGNETSMRNSENTLKLDSTLNDSVKAKKSKKIKSQFQGENDTNSINENVAVLTDEENRLTHFSLNNSSRQTDQDGKSAKYDFSCSLPESEERLEAILFN